MIADAENHSAIAATWQTAMIETEPDLRVTGPQHRHMPFSPTSIPRQILGSVTPCCP